MNVEMVEYVAAKQSIRSRNRNDSYAAEADMGHVKKDTVCKHRSMNIIGQSHLN